MPEIDSEDVGQDRTGNQPVPRVWGQPDRAEPKPDPRDGFHYHKLTGENVEARLTQGARRGRDSMKRFVSPAWLRGYAAAGLIVIAAVAAGVSSAGENAYVGKRAANLSTIEKLKAEVSALEATIVEQPDANSTTKYVEEAGVSGAAMALAQNEYLSLGLKSSDTEKVKAISDRLAGYLAQGSAQNARTPWIPALGDLDTGGGNPNYSWSFVSAAPSATGDATTVDMLWTLRKSPSGELVGWATGDYDAVTKKVVTLAWGVTSKGASLIPKTDSVGVPGANSPSSSSSSDSSQTSTGTASVSSTGTASASSTPAPVTTQTEDPQPSASSTSGPGRSTTLPAPASTPSVSGTE